jgi:hypothetical protein
MVLHAQHLAIGSNLLCLPIKVNKITLNVRQSVSCFGQPSVMSLALTGTSKNSTLQRWESIPDRREPSTVEMLNAMHDGTFGHQDHLHAAAIGLAAVCT